MWGLEGSDTGNLVCQVPWVEKPPESVNIPLSAPVKVFPERGKLEAECGQCHPNIPKAQLGLDAVKEGKEEASQAQAYKHILYFHIPPSLSFSFFLLPLSFLWSPLRRDPCPPCSEDSHL